MIRTDLEEYLPEVVAVPVQIQQVLLNLIVNALDAVECRPVSERRIIISTHSLERDKVEVSIHDFGKGLPADQPEKVFDYFFSTKQQDMGMGLTIVRSIIESHDGRIGAENATDGGARFFFTLPAVRRQSKEQAA